MPHPRQQIRDAVATQLAAMPSVVTVQAGRVENFAQAELPGALVYTRNEGQAAYNTVGGIGTTGRQVVRVVELAVELYGRDLTDPDQELDDLALEMEQALDFTALPVKDWELQAVFQAGDPEGEQPVGTIRYEWAVSYLINEQTPGTII